MNKYYRILFLEESATLSEVKKAYRKLAKKYHPDKNSGSEEYAAEFRNIQDAYEKILDHLAYKNERAESKNDFNKSKDSNSTDKQTEQSKKTQSQNSQKSNSKEQNTKNENADNNYFDDIFTDFEDDFEKENKVSLVCGIGENINVGYFEYNVIKFEFSKSVGESFLKSEADGIYLIIELKITNKSNVQRKLHNYMFRVSNIENDYFEYSTKGLSIISMSGVKCIDIFGKEFNPKIPVALKLIFEVPEKDIYFLNLCGGEYNWDENNICHCKEIEVVKLT